MATAGKPTKTADQKARDLRLILGATIAVLLGGIVIAAAILQVISKGPKLVVERPLPFGLAREQRKDVREGGPIYFAGPQGDDGFWIDLEDGELVALLVNQPRPASCQLRWRGSKERFECGGEPVTVEHLARFRSFVQRSGPTKGSFMVAVRDVVPPPAGPPAFATTTAAGG